LPPKIFLFTLSALYELSSVYQSSKISMMILYIMSNNFLCYDMFVKNEL